MRIDRRLTLIGILLVILSMTMATQYATTKIGYSYGIVHPSDGAIRFIGSDNSTDGIRVLRTQSLTNASPAIIEVVFGNLSANQNKTYTAAFAIVNEEPFAINITHINLSHPGDEYMKIWLHGNPRMRACRDPSSVIMFNNNVSTGDWYQDEAAWTLARGDQNPRTMRYNVSNAASEITTYWDTTAHVQYSLNSSVARNANRTGGMPNNSLDNASDFVWVQISLDLPADAEIAERTGIIWIHFQATTLYGEP
jgi:hypothetical protein